MKNSDDNNVDQVTCEHALVALVVLLALLEELLGFAEMLLVPLSEWSLVLPAIIIIILVIIIIITDLMMVS